jgi:hypothetical protein
MDDDQSSFWQTNCSKTATIHVYDAWMVFDRLGSATMVCENGTLDGF